MGEEEEGEMEEDDAWNRAWKGEVVGGDAGGNRDDLDGTMVGGLELCVLRGRGKSLAAALSSSSSLAVFDQMEDDDDLGGEVGLSEDDLGEGMTSDDMGGGVGRLGGWGEDEGWGWCWLGPFPAACCIRQWILNQLDLLP